MKVYGHPQSLGTRKALLTLAEKGCEAQLIRLDLARGDQGRPAHLARHPFGKVPVLEDQGFWLYESLAIVRYLDATLPGPALAPQDPRARAQLDQWLSVEASYVGPALWKITSQVLLGPMYGQEPDPCEVAEGRREVGQTLDVLDRALERRAYLVADAFSLAEVSLMPSLQQLVTLGQADLIAARPNVAHWWERMRARPSWRHVLALSPRRRQALDPAASFCACA